MRELAFLNSAATLRFRALNEPRGSRQGAADINGAHSTNGASGNASSSSSSSADDTGQPGSSDGAPGTLTPPAARHDFSSGEVTDADGWRTFQYSGGLREYVSWLNRDNSPLHEAVYVKKEVDSIQVGSGLLECWQSQCCNLPGCCGRLVPAGAISSCPLVPILCCLSKILPLR